MKRVVLFTVVCTFALVVLGAYVRLNDAGLSCPDWPGCYGNLLVPQGEQVEAAQALYPDRPLEEGKAWLEMGHRYLAGFLGLLVLIICYLSFGRRKKLPGSVVILTFLLVPLLLFQALLGMWTVTHMLHPATVTGHLAGGMAILLLLWCIYLLLPMENEVVVAPTDNMRLLRYGALVAIAVLFLQMMLGGWTSANYAALVCDAFPGCKAGYALPDGEAFSRIFDLQGAGSEVAEAIHMTHRIGAVVTTIVLTLLAWFCWRHTSLRANAAVMVFLLALHLLVAIVNIFTDWPVATATLHNALAAMLLLSTASVLMSTARGRRVAVA